MAARNKGKTPAKARTPTLIDGLTKEEISKEQMKEHIMRLREDLDREREERNYFQLERDKIQNFWDITQRQLDEVKAERKNLDRDFEENERRHQLEIKVYKQKMKHLLCEHQNTIAELKADGVASTQALQVEQEKLEAKLQQDMMDVRVDMEEYDPENLIKELELKHEERMAQTRSNLEKLLAETRAHYEKKLELLPQELDSVAKNVINEAEDYWSSYSNDVTAEYDTVLTGYEEFNLIHDNLRKINEQLKTQIKKMTSSEVKEKTESLSQDNKRLAELLRQAEEQSAKHDKILRCYPSYQNNKYEKLKLKELDEEKRAVQTLKQKFNKVEQERDELSVAITTQTEKIQSEANVQLTLLESLIEDKKETLIRSEAQLSAVLSASNMDHAALLSIISKVESDFDSRGNAMKTSQYNKALITKTREDLLLT